MPDTDLKYRAFLSYSHADTGVALRVHRRLESFHIDKELVGRVTPAGPIPKVLRPIFRDRNDFDAGSSLGAETGTALDDSAALVLLASPHATRSKYVNEEVRLFKLRHPDRPVVPLIIDGSPGDAENECFPPALRFAIAPDGAITDTPDDVLAADLREKGDGFELALAKVVARLIGLAPDDVYRRAERERRRQGRLRLAIAAVIALLAIGGGGLFWQSTQQKQTLNEIAALVDKYSLVAPAEAAIPGAKQSLTQAITAIAQGAATDPRYAQALALLKAGKPDQAEPLLKAVAEDKEKRAERLAKSDPGNAGWQRDLSVSYDRIGNVQKAQGNLPAALTSYQAALAIRERLAKSDPGNVGWQSDLSVSYAKLAIVYLRSSQMPQAQEALAAGRAVAAQLTAEHPEYSQWKQDLVWFDLQIAALKKLTHSPD